MADVRPDRPGGPASDPHGHPDGSPDAPAGAATATGVDTRDRPRTGSSAADGGRPAGEPGRSVPAQRVLLLLAVLLPVAVVLWRTRDAFRYYQDDVLQFAVAQERGLSWDLLGLDVFQHFAPVNRLAHLVVIRFSDLSLTFGMLLAAAAVLLLLATTAWLLHELRVPFGRRVLGLVALGFSITVLDTAVWADAAFHILPALVATNAVVAAHLRAATTGHRRWDALAVVLLALGTLTQERVLFALPLVVLVDWFLVGAGRPLPERWRRLRRSVPTLVAMTVVALAAAAYIYLEYASGVSSRPSVETTLRTGLGALTQGIFPPWVGVRLTALSSLQVQLVILAGIVLVAAALVVLRRRNADPLAFVALCFVMYFGFLSFSPILTDELAAATALRLHNGAYLLVPTVLAVTSLTGRRARRPAPDAAGADGSRRSGGPWHANRTWPVAVAAAVLATFLVVMGGRFTDAQWYAERNAHAYLATVSAGQQTWADPEATLVPLLVAPTVARDWAEVYGRHEFFLRFYEPGWVPQELGDRPVVLDAAGDVRPVQLRTEAAAVDLAADSCAPADRSQLAVAAEVTGEPLFLQLSYTAAEPLGVVATPDAGVTQDAAAVGNWEVPLEAGAHTVLIPLHAGTVGGVLLDWTGPSSDRCVVGASIVRPVFSGADGGTCTDMDRYGLPLATVPCPAGSSR
ncbi:hypothetical protein [Modestobacter versicolor]|uniref:hypothetical protein n=1 Tax=Modestobacter versicolor TaxID=429133 RepID=UPI0034DF6BDA